MSENGNTGWYELQRGNDTDITLWSQGRRRRRRRREKKEGGEREEGREGGGEREGEVGEETAQEA